MCIVHTCACVNECVRACVRVCVYVCLGEGKEARYATFVLETPLSALTSGFPVTLDTCNACTIVNDHCNCEDS